MTILEYARKKKIVPIMKKVAEEEGMEVNILCEKIADGKIVIPANRNHDMQKPCGIGEGLRTKVNANIGTSKDRHSIVTELKKLRVALESGADTIMDLSTGGDLKKIRKLILKNCPVPLGTVPIYEAVVSVVNSKRVIFKMSDDDLLSVIEAQAKEGVDFQTIHCGVTLESIERLRKEGRIMDVVSRGGAFLIEWMVYNKRENPLYEKYDRILEIARKYDVTLSLGDGMRPGAIADATDRAQIQEMILLGELAKRAQEAGVQVMIEGPGHVPLNQIAANVQLEKRLCHGAPFYGLGPLVTDVAPGYDHITSAIGGALAASYGADFLCYVTPSEHLRLPTVEDVREGVISSRIAAHAADVAKGVKGALQWDIEMSKARKQLNWKKQFELAIDGKRAEKLRGTSRRHIDDVCTMCGEYCAIKVIKETLK
jgi:phosphomethylpyrimidine synthase